MNSFPARFVAAAGRLRATLLIVAFPVIALAAPPAQPQQLPAAFRDAWNGHDGHALAELMADDVDFVNVGAVMLHGRADFETMHTRLLGGRFAQAILTVLETKVRLLRPDLALVHWSWSVTGDKNADGSSRPPRFGLMVMVAEKRRDVWVVTAAHNTNAVAGAASVPESAGIKPAIAMPQTAAEK
jgi:uncharacterized protein (TIGR02246 family)